MLATGLYLWWLTTEPALAAVIQRAIALSAVAAMSAGHNGSCSACHIPKGVFILCRAQLQTQCPAGPLQSAMSCFCNDVDFIAAPRHTS